MALLLGYLNHAGSTALLGSYTIRYGLLGKRVVVRDSGKKMKKQIYNNKLKKVMIDDEDS